MGKKGNAGKYHYPMIWLLLIVAVATIALSIFNTNIFRVKEMKSIQESIQETQKATFSISLPSQNEKSKGLPSPCGTGFFISKDGWFVTAAHVVEDQKLKTCRTDLDQSHLVCARSIKEPKRFLKGMKIDFYDRQMDFALLKVDLDSNLNQFNSSWLQKSTGFPFIKVSKRELKEGEQIYCFGYPLSEQIVSGNKDSILATDVFYPRTTGAIISSLYHSIGGKTAANLESKIYVIDKALNYGNSGGPIISVSKGYVHAFCSEFQPMLIPQPNGQPPIFTPSLYGIVRRLSTSQVLEILSKRGIRIEE